MLSADKVRHLKKILSPSQIIFSPAEILTYATDASNIIGKPDLVCLPKDKRDVVEILKYSYMEVIPVVPRGSGTGVTGGASPVYGGMVVSLSRMCRILDIDRQNMIAEVEPGVITGDIKDEVERVGLFYPPDPASLKACTIGGNLAENAGGPKAVKYGVTRDYCLGLEAILSDGRTLCTGAKTRKSVVGYDLTGLMVGSEGTLGIITKAFLRLIPKPETTRTMSIFFPSVDDAVNAIMHIFSTGITPSMLEIMDKESIRCVSSYLDMDIPPKKDTLLLLEIDGEERAVKVNAERIKGILSKECCADFKEAEEEEERERLFLFRRSLSPAIYRLGSKKVNEDICVPRNLLPVCFRALEEIGKRYDLKMANFGHAGDGNIHVNILLRDDDRELIRARNAVKDIFKMTIKLGGTISGEHGIGLTKAPYLDMELDSGSIDLMKRIKREFDPLGLLNPGKIFPIN